MSATDIFLSPHHDDVCFSLAATVLARRGGELINLFTRSEHVAAKLALPADRRARVREVTRLRTEEDRAYAARSLLRRHDLMLAEPSLLGFHPFSTRELAREVEQLSGPLLELLERLRTREHPAGLTLFCPMGIGGHRNHLATLAAVAGNLPRIRQFCRVFLYEDLPYASKPAARTRGVASALRLLSDERLLRLVVPLSAQSFAEKMRVVGGYASQHAGPPAPAQFIPASPLARGPHEALWRLVNRSTSPSGSRRARAQIPGAAR